MAFKNCRLKVLQQIRDVTCFDTLISIFLVKLFKYFYGELTPKLQGITVDGTTEDFESPVEYLTKQWLKDSWNWLIILTYACNSFTIFSTWSAQIATTGNGNVVNLLKFGLKKFREILLLIVGAGFSRIWKYWSFRVKCLESNWPSKVWIELNLGWLQPNQAKYIFNWNSSKQFLLLNLICHCIVLFVLLDKGSIFVPELF